MMKYEIGKRIKEYRVQSGLTQKQLGEEIGVSNARVSNWENGENRPDADTLMAICKVLGVTADTLLGIKKESATIDELSENERRLISVYRSLNTAQREKFLDFIESL